MGGSLSWRVRDVLTLLTAPILGLLAAEGVATDKPAPLIIQEQGSFAVGGTVATAPGTFDPILHGAYNPADQSVAGQTFHGAHAYVFYPGPENPRPLPLVMWHGPDLWRRFIGTARLWRDAVNKRGGDVTLVHLPGVGIRGNTHFMMSDLNNVQIADLLSGFLAEKKLD
jgi:hypothetical protein